MINQQFDSSSSVSNVHEDKIKVSAYQLLRLRDFENDPDQIEKAYANISQELEEAKATLSNSEAKAEYDEQLKRTGYAGLPQLGFWGGSAVFFSFVLSIAIVFVSTFYIYPMIVPVDPEPIGDSITTLAEKDKQQDITTMNVNMNIPITVDMQFDDELIESEATTDEPTVETPAPTPTQPEPTAPDTSAPVEPAEQQLNSASATEQQPVDETSVSEQPVSEQPVSEQPVAEQPVVPVVSEESVPLPEPMSTPENPASDQTSEPGLLEVSTTSTPSDTPVTEPPAVSAVENSTLQSVGTQPLTAPKQIPTSIVNAIAESAKTVQTKEQYEQLFKSAQQAETELIKNKEFVYAEQIADIVYKACLTPEGKPFRSEKLRHKEQISKFTKQWIDVSAAQVRFTQMEDKTQPSSDADIIATWTIDVDNDWNAGLQYLLSSTNEHVRNAAQKDKNTDISNVESCIATADAWWNVSQTPSALQKQFRNRSHYWYSKALPSVTDKNTKTLIEKRLSMTK